MTGKLSYGWVILAACFLILLLSNGTHLSFGVMFKPMAAEFGWERAALSSVYLLNMTVFAISLIFLGRLYDRYGAKWILIISTTLMCAGYVLTAHVTALWQLYLSYGVLTALGLGGASTPLISSLISKWFDKWRGLAVSLALTGASVGQFTLVPFLTRITIEHDWRTAYLVISAISFVGIVTLTLLIIREAPANAGEKPFATLSSTSAAAADGQSGPDEGGLNLTEAMRTRSFWLFLIAMSVCGGNDFFIVTHFVPMVTDYGISATDAGTMLASYGLASLAGLVLAGPASDLIGNKIPILFSFVVRFALMLLVLNVHTAAAFYLFALAFGFTFLITAPITPTLLGKMFGLAHLGTIMGVAVSVHHLSGGLWVFFGGLVFDHTDSYRLVFIAAAVLALVAFLCSLFLVDQRHERIATSD